MKVDDLILRCYAEEDEDETWFAICLDLNLYARADSFEEARQKLNRLIRTYIKEALGKDANYISDLMPRRAPFYFWAKYAIFKTINRLYHFASKQDFELPLPLAPAV